MEAMRITNGNNLAGVMYEGKNLIGFLAERLLPMTGGFNFHDLGDLLNCQLSNLKIPVDLNYIFYLCVYR